MKKQEDKINTLDYYTMEVCKKIIDNVPNSKWRIWKTKDADGICRQNKFSINSPEKLLRFIRQCKNPQSLYVSISQFLKPESNHGFFANQKTTLKDGRYFYPRSGYINADCILLDTFYFIDIDHPSDLRIVQEDGRRIIQELGMPDFLRFSGTKGIHLGYKQELKHIEDPTERVEYYKKQKQSITNRLLNLDLQTLNKTHINILNDVFRVIAAPYSIKREGGVVIPLSVEDFMQKDIYTLLSLKPTRVSRKVAREVLEGTDDSKVASDGEQSSSQLYRHGGGASLTPQPIFFRFVDNIVKGLNNNYVTVIKKHKKHFKLDRIKQLQKLYHLSDFCIYSWGDYIYAYNFKINLFAREAKILRMAKSENLSFFLTRGHAPLPISGARDGDNQMVDRMEFVGALKSQYGLNHDHSLSHCRMFKFNYNHMVGKEDISIGTMRVS